MGGMRLWGLLEPISKYLPRRGVVEQTQRSRRRKVCAESKNALYFEVFFASFASWRTLRCFQGV